jgi:hypothetical protein
MNLADELGKYEANCCGFEIPFFCPAQASNPLKCINANVDASELVGVIKVSSLLLILLTCVNVCCSLLRSLV